MNKINASLISFGIVFALSSCKKDKVSNIDCEIKTTRQVSSIFGNSSNDIIMHFNSAKQVIDMVTSVETLSYIHEGNEVIVRSSRGIDIDKIGLDNGRAVTYLPVGSNDLQKISYDSEGRMKQILLEHEGIVTNIFTFYYVGGNLDYVHEEMKVGEGVERTYSFEYTDLKPDASNQAFQSFFEQVLRDYIPATFRGLGSVNLPSKMTEKASNSTTEVVKEYTYTTSPDGSVTGRRTQYTVFSKVGQVVITENINITSTCK